MQIALPTQWKNLSFTLLLAAVVFSLPELAMAGEALGNILCGILKVMRSGTFRAVATIGIIFLGIGALMGKVSWGMAIMVTIGVVLIFGATEIIDLTIGTGDAADGVNTGDAGTCYE